MRILTVFIVLMLLAGCSTRKSDQVDEEAVAQAPATEEVSEQTKALEPAQAPDDKPGSARADVDAWSQKALLSHPRMTELKAKADPAMGEPGSTDWRAAQGVDELKALQAESPAQLLARASQALHFNSALGVDVWEQTVRIFQDDDQRAQGILMSWGAKDDSVAGADYLVKMNLEGEQWKVDSVEERIHCWRGVGEEGLCR